MLRTYPGEAGALTVSASPLRYIKSNALVSFPGKNSLDISASQPASGLARFVGIYLDPDDNTLKSVDGATTSDSPAITPDSPSFPESAILSANVRLDGDQTIISEVDIVDVRQILDASGAIDGTRISKLVSPDGLTDPVFSVDNSGDATLAGTGNLIVPVDIQHAGDVDTKIIFTDDKVTIDAGGLEMIAFIEAATDEVVINDGQVDINFRVEGDTEGNLILVDAGTDTVIIAGTTADQLLASVFTVVNKTTDHTTPKIASYVNFAPNLSSASAQTYRAMQFEAQLDGSGGNTANIIGVIGEARYNQTSGTLADLTAASAAVRVINAGDVTAGFGYRIVPILTSTGNLATYRGFEARSPILTSSGAITTAQAVYIHQQNVTGVTTGYGIYQSHASDINYFNGDSGIGVVAPQGKFHTYDTISGFLVWEYDGLDATVRTVIANGTGDVLYRLHASYVLRDSAAAVASGTTDVSNSASVNLTVGGNTVRLRVNADGSCDVARTAGTDTIKVALTLRWL
jgi:hypothetical protein